MAAGVDQANSPWSGRGAVSAGGLIRRRDRVFGDARIGLGKVVPFEQQGDLLADRQSVGQAAARLLSLHGIPASRPE